MKEQGFSLWRGSVTIPRTSQDILRETAADHGMSVADMLSPARQRPYIRARWDAMMRLSLTLNPAGRLRSLVEIGRQMGGLDHTTVRHALKKSGSPRYAKSDAKREAEAA